jgi:hypothetical protein
MMVKVIDGTKTDRISIIQSVVVREDNAIDFFFNCSADQLTDVVGILLDQTFDQLVSYLDVLGPVTLVSIVCADSGTTVQRRLEAKPADGFDRILWPNFIYKGGGCKSLVS